MSKKRIMGEGGSCYHVMSRTVSDTKGGLLMFGSHEKSVFARQMRKHAEFAGVEVLTWCMMDNHFHLLVRIPDKEVFLEELMKKGRERFWKNFRALYSRTQLKALRAEVSRLEKEEGTGAEVTALLEPYTERMADLSTFVKELKFAFSVWFNRKYGRRGTLWMERFKSVLLEGEPSVLKKVAAYVDLNPIRAGLVTDPGDYRWSGYGQAVGGRVDARRGLSAVHGYTRNEWTRVGTAYRALLYLEGAVVRDTQGRVVRCGVGSADFDREMASGGSESAGKRLARRVRYFADGLAIGSREFLEHVFEKNKKQFGQKRVTGARKFRGKEWKHAGLFSLRDLAV